jgi:CBS-domain-containing membrane protein
MLDYLSDAVTVSLALLAMWAFLSPCVPSGIFGTAGAAGVAIAALGSLDYWMSPSLVVNVFIGSCLLICLQIMWRVWAMRKAR